MGTQTRVGRPAITDYRRYLDDRIDQAKRRIKGADAGTGIAIVVVAWISYVLLLVMIDQIVELPALVRTALLVAMILVSGAVLLLRVVIPLFFQVNALFAARSIESADPTMKNSVVSWVDISKSADELPEPILRNIGSRAATDLSRVRIEDAIQPRHVLTSMYVLAGVVIVFCGFSFFTTKSFGPTVQRVLFPFAGIAPPTATQLHITFFPSRKNDGLSPAVIPVGASMTCKARVERGSPSKVTAYIQAEGSDYEEPQELSRVDPKSSEFVLALHQRQKSFGIRFVADDFRSEIYTVHVTPSPTIVDWNIHYDPPAYTGQTPYTSAGPDIDALEGTRVSIEATASGPVEPASGRLDVRMGGRDSTVPLAMVEGSSNRFSGEFVVTAEGSYSVAFRDSDGRAPDFIPNNHIRVRLDLPPSLEISEPAKKEVELAANETLVIRGRASDDFGLRKVTINVRDENGGELRLQREIGKPGEQLGESREFLERSDLAKWKVEPGDVLEYWIEAEDNKLPVANLSSTKPDHRLVRIVAPKKPEPNQDQGKQDGDPKAGNSATPKDKPSEAEKNPKRDDSEKSGGQADSGDGKPSDEKSGGQGQGSESGKEGSEPADHAGANGTNDKSANEGSQGEKGPSRGNDPNGAENQAESGNSGEKQSELSKEDRESLDKLNEYFEKDPAKGGSKKQSEPEGETKEASQGSQSDKAENTKGEEEAKSKSGSASDDSKGQPQPDSKDQKDSAAGEKKGSPPSESPSKGQNPKTQQSPKNSPNESKESGSSDASRPDSAKENAGDKSSNQDGSSPKSENGKSAEKKESQRTVGGQEGTDESSSSTSDSKGKSGQKASAGEGKEGDSGDGPRPDQAQPGDPSQKDNGEATGRADDQAPRPGSEKKAEEQNPDGSHRDGPDKGSAANAANSEGQANQGESSTAGQSSAGSPSDEKGDNSNSTGKQNGEGQSSGKGDKQQGDKSASKKSDGSPENGPPSKSTDDMQGGQPKPGQGDKPDGEEKPGQQPGNNSGQSQESDNGDDAKPASDSSKDGQGQDKQPGKPSDSNSPDNADSSQPSEPGKAAQGNPNGAGNLDPDKIPQGQPKGNNGDLDNSGDAPDADDAKKGSNLVLRRLEEELHKKKVDPELLRRMGWTEEDARRFYDRLREQAAKAEKAGPMTVDKRKGFGQGTDLRKRSERAAGTTNDAQQGLETGRRTAVPPQIRKRYEAYTKSLSESTNSAKPAPGQNPPK